MPADTTPTLEEGRMKPTRQEVVEEIYYLAGRLHESCGHGPIGPYGQMSNSHCEWRDCERARDLAARVRREGVVDERD